MKTRQRLGWGRGVGAVAVLVLGGVAACGSSFASDCRESRTCPVVPGDNAAGAGSGGAPDGNAGAGPESGGAGTGAGVDVGAAGAEAALPVGGAGGDTQTVAGAGGHVDCHVAKNCFNEPPTVVAITPADTTEDVEPDTTIVIELSEPLDEATVNADNIRILDGETVVAGALSYADSKITFTPAKPLALLASYEVSLSTGLTDAEGAGLAEAFGSSFAVRDGAWSVTTVVPGTITTAPAELQLNSDGQALVTWIGTGEGTCPATARWYLRGAPVGSAKTFNFSRTTSCTDLHSAVSPGGVGVLSWYEESNVSQGIATAEFRAGKWGGVTERSQRNDNYNGAVAATDDGTVHYLAAATDVLAWQTSTAGVWSKTGKALSARTPLAPPQVAVAKNGDAVAVWVDTDATIHARIMVATYAKQSATWSSAAVLPGSLSSEGASDRGAPAVAFDDANRPFVVWRRGAEFVASRFDSVQAAWAGATTIASGLVGTASREPPALVFDGRTFVVAYDSTVAAVTSVYTARYDEETDTWSEPKLMANAATQSVARMPRLSSDAHGNLLLVWPSLVKKGVYAMAYQRFDAREGAWLGAKLIAGVTINHAYFTVESGKFALGGSANGLAALVFSDSATWPNNLQLASFY